MDFTPLEKNMDIISALDDEPNDVGGLTATELKAKFDEGGNAIKDYLNNTMIPEVKVALGDKAGKDELQGLVLGYFDLFHVEYLGSFSDLPQKRQ